VTGGKTRRRDYARRPNFGEVLIDVAEQDPRRSLIFAEGVDLSYSEVDMRARRCARVCQTAGVRPGDRVALAVGNNWRYIEMILGLMRLGAIAVPLNIKLGRDALAFIVEDSGASCVFVDQRYEERLNGLSVPLVTTEDYEEQLAGVEPLDLAAHVALEECAMLMYTSGSTGRPKGVMLSYRSLWWQAYAEAAVKEVGSEDRGLVMGPLYHANALWGVLYPMLYVGGSVVILPEFEATAAIEAIARYRVTFTGGTPSMFRLLLRSAQHVARDLACVKLISCGSAPVSDQLMVELSKLFGGCDLVESYGLTEGGAIIATPRGKLRRRGSCGRPSPYVELRVLGSDGLKCEAEKVGELWVRSPGNMIGYWTTESELVLRSEDDWLRTKDLFHRDEEGYYYFHGRTDDRINVGGENVYPKEVESILLEHPCIADVSVVAAFHNTKGEAPVAWVVVSPGCKVTESELQKFFLQRGPAYAHPRRVFVVDALPLAGTNKVDRQLLKRWTVECLPQGIER